MGVRLSGHFKLNKSQAELDFVDVPLNGDIPLFIDPHALGKREDVWSIEASNLVVDFFQQAIAHIRQGEDNRAKAILSHLGEPNETGLGLSKKGRRGRGVAGQQSLNLFDYLKDSTAARTGFLRDLEDCELLVPGISNDKISDITTNIVREKLVEYTINQCDLLGIPTRLVPAGRFWDTHHHDWSEDEYQSLPVHQGRRLLFVPKAIARYRMAYDYQEYYNNYVLTYLQAYHLDSRTSLVELLRNGKRRVTKKSLKEIHPLSKEYLYQFSKENPAIFEQYKNETRDLRELDDATVQASTGGSTENGDGLVEKLKRIPAGAQHADAYHECVIGLLEALFYPSLIYPKKEQSLHDGRKRIDITYSNAAKSGFFSWLHSIKKIPCPFIMVECKNYSADPENPELDQLAGRFSVQRGQFGLLVCRTCADRKLFQKRCRDTAVDGRGYILMLTDKDIEDLLNMRAARQDDRVREWLDNEFRTLVF